VRPQKPEGPKLSKVWQTTILCLKVKALNIFNIQHLWTELQHLRSSSNQMHQTRYWSEPFPSVSFTKYKRASFIHLELIQQQEHLLSNPDVRPPKRTSFFLVLCHTDKLDNMLNGVITSTYLQKESTSATPSEPYLEWGQNIHLYLLYITGSKSATPFWTVC